MLMQMLAAGGLPVVSDAKRVADEDNPRGYLEFEPVKNLMKDSSWLSEARGKAVKIVAPLLAALPPGLPCRVILCERDLEEVLDSQEQMLVHRKFPMEGGPDRRRILKEEYMRVLGRVNAMLVRRPETEVLVVHYAKAVSDARGTADKVNRFLGGGLDVIRMAAQVDPNLHRNQVSLNSRDSSLQSGRRTT